jgi:hypothetical protein
VSTPTKWEYTALESLGWWNITPTLAESGSEGWELVSAFRGEGSKVVCVLKRPAQPGPPTPPPPPVGTAGTEEVLFRRLPTLEERPRR